MKRIPVSVLVTLTALVALSSCASYRAAPLNTVASDMMFQPSSDQGGVMISAKAFSRSDCKTYLDRDVISKGYQPVQLYIENNSNRVYQFSLSRISLSCARPEEVAEKVHTSTIGRAVGYGTAALFLWPMAIPAIVDGVKSANANESLDTDFSAKTARDQLLFQHSHLNKLIFVPVCDFQSTFKVTLIDQESHESKVFHVTAN